jgi:hypothetical protein
MIKLTLMCDYCADGLWDNKGRAIHCSDIKELYNFTIPKKICKNIELWQDMYENFNFYESREITKKELETEEFIEFETLGEKIFQDLSKIIPENVTLEYFNERTNERLL